MRRMRHTRRPLMAQAMAALLITCGAAPSVRAAAPETRLVLVGGGERDREAMARFVDWAGGGAARLLVVTWASSEPAASYTGLVEDLVAHHPAQIEAAPNPPLTATSRAALLAQIGRASGIFFGGGDQVRIMDVLKDAELLAAFRRRHAEGVVFGGTSAGTAAMSGIMITGEGDFKVIDADKVETRDGLGLLPGAIIDQHFIKRQRENRLFGLVLRHPELLGVGVNEDAALLVRDGRHAEAIGGMVMLVDGREARGGLVVRLLHAGERYDLSLRKPE
jgi:cyanophycinase